MQKKMVGHYNDPVSDVSELLVRSVNGLMVHCHGKELRQECCEVGGLDETSNFRSQLGSSIRFSNCKDKAGLEQHLPKPN